MKYCNLFFVFLLISMFFSTYTNAAWYEIPTNDNELALDGIWGSSENNIYAINFDQKVFHCTSDCNNTDSSGWEDITDIVFKSMPNLHPMGIWGIDADNVYIVGTMIENNISGFGFNNYSSIIFKYNGKEWEQIFTSSIPKTENHYPHWLLGVWGRAPNDLYFCGGHAIMQQGSSEPDHSAVILHYDGTNFHKELSLTTIEDDFPQIQGITGFSLENSNEELFAVGLEGFLLHKNTSKSEEWERMNINTDAPHFFRVWGYAEPESTADKVFAVGFDNNSASAVIYQYSNWTDETEKSWKPTIIPKTREGIIPALWGVWGDVAEKRYHAVGNEGVSLYLDTSDNPDNINWQQMISAVDTSFNQVWGTSFGNAYAASESGKVFWFDGTIKRSGVYAAPATGFEPFTANFSDISVDNVIKWEWNFGEGKLPAVSATADLDYKLLLTAPAGAAYNDTIIEIVDNGNRENTTKAPTHKFIDAVPPTADLAGKIFITGIIDEKLNKITIIVKDGGKGYSPSVRYNGSNIILTIDAGVTTQSTMADLLSSHRLIQSAVCEEPYEPWSIVEDDDDNNEKAYVNFSGCSFKKIRVAIESEKIRQGELAEYLVKELDIVESAVPDNELCLWTVNEEVYSNAAKFSGGSDNPNIYINEDTTIAYYFMATHTYKKVGNYTITLKITRPEGKEPEIPEIETTTINVIKNPLDFKAEPCEKVNTLDAVFRYTGPSLLVEDNEGTKITELNWSFGDFSDIVSADNANTAITHKTSATASHLYTQLGSYDVKLTVTLKDNSKLSITKKDYIVVESSDEDKLSWNGGAGCFINSAKQGKTFFLGR